MISLYLAQDGFNTSNLPIRFIYIYSKVFFNFRNKSAICSMVCQDLVTFSLVKVELRVVCFMACMNISYYLAVWLYLDWFYWFPVDTLLF